MQGKKIRLIYFGRVLPQGVRLASWLDALSIPDATSASGGSGSTKRESGMKDGVSVQDCLDSLHDHDPLPYERILVERVPQEDGMYTLRRPASISSHVTNSKSHGKQRDLEMDHVDRTMEVCAVCLPTIFLQCSIGGQLDAHEPNASEAGPSVSTTNEPRGFDRLRYTAGMSDMDIQLMREQFHRQSGLLGIRSGDVLRQREEDNMVYAMEDQWIDNMGQDPVQRQVSSVWKKGMWGLLIGFLFPLLPLFFVYDSPMIPWPRRSALRLAHQAQVLQHTRELESLLAQLSERLDARSGELDTAQRARIDNVRRSVLMPLDQFRQSVVEREATRMDQHDSGTGFNGNGLHTHTTANNAEPREGRQAHDNDGNTNDNSGSNWRGNGHDEDDEDDDDEVNESDHVVREGAANEGAADPASWRSPLERLGVRAPRVNHYVVFSPVTLFCIMIGFLVKYVHPHNANASVLVCIIRFAW